MVARLFGLRLTLLAAVFRGAPSQVLRRLLAGLGAVVAVLLLAWLPGALIGDTEDRAVVDVVIGAVVLSLVVIVPFFVNRGHLEPRQFTAYPVEPWRIAVGLLASSVLSWSFLLLLVWLVALGVLRTEWHAAGGALTGGLALAALIALVGVRLTSALAKLLVPPAQAGLVRAIGVLLAVAVVPIAVFGVAGAFEAPSSGPAADAARVLGWTPFGAPFTGIARAASGESATGPFVLAALTALLLIAVWFPVVRLSLRRIDRPANPAIARRGLGWFERFPARPASAIGARALTYWSRDPRYRVALFALPIAPVVMVVAFWIAGADLHWLILLPLPVIMLLLGWSLHNDVAMDSTAIWVHVASGVRGRYDRLGRLAPALLLGLPLALVGASVTVTLLADWRVFPAVLGMNLSVLFVALGVSSVSSVRAPYPTTRPGDSPFVQPTGAGMGGGVAQTTSLAISLLLALPPVLLAAWAVIDVEFLPNALAFFAGVGYGLLVLALGVLIGGRMFTRSGPELIALTQVFD